MLYYIVYTEFVLHMHFVLTHCGLNINITEIYYRIFFQVYSTLKESIHFAWDTLKWDEYSKCRGVRPMEKIFVFHITRPNHVKNPRPKKVFLTFRQTLVFGCVFRKINCFALFSFYFCFYFWSARSYSDCSITYKSVIKHNCKIRINFTDQHLHWLTKPYKFF